MTEPNEFQEDRKIDPVQLDVECVRQSDLFGKWAERAVDAKALVEDLDLRVEVREAELELEIRAEPEKFGFDGKPTEAGIKAKVTCHPELVKLRKKLLAAKKASSLLDKATQTMEMRKRMLGDLVTLHGQQYFAGPEIPRNLTKAWERSEALEKQKKITRKRKDSSSE